MVKFERPLTLDEARAVVGRLEKEIGEDQLELLKEALKVVTLKETLPAEPRVWTVTLEGIEIGRAVGPEPMAAITAAFNKAGINSLPEGIIIKVADEKDAYVVFAMDKQVFCASPDVFSADVAKSSRWISVVTRNRMQREAALTELRAVFTAKRAR